MIWLLRNAKKYPCTCSGIGLILILFYGCGIKLVADYDAAAYDAILSTAKQVDTFYVKLLETPENERQYKGFADQYTAIEVEIRSLVMRSKIHPLNEDSTGIAEIILDKWLKYKEAHESTNTYKSALVQLHWQRFTRLFTAMAVAEEAKRLAGENTL